MISLVVPFYNEEEIIDQTVSEVTSALLSISEDYEVICVDDGSTDTTLQKLIHIHQNNSRVKVVALSRNFGHQAAYTAGLNHAKGDHVGMIDGDLQDPPELIKEMYDKLVNEKLDIVYGKRLFRKEGFLKQLLIKGFHVIFNKLSSVKAPANVGNFSLMSRNAVNELIALKEKNRYLPGLRFFVGFKQGFVSYDRPDRQVGKAKMSLRKLFMLALDAFFSFSAMPIKVCIFLGIIGVIFSFCGGMIVIVKKFNGVAIPGWTSILLSIYFFGSLQLLFLGIIGEYIYRIFVETRERPIYIVKDYFE